MQYIHVVNGDVAGNTLRQALAQAARPDPVVVLRDDLAVGPIADVDSTGLIRSGFWQRVAPHTDIDEAGVGPELRPDTALAAVVRVGLECGSGLP